MFSFIPPTISIIMMSVYIQIYQIPNAAKVRRYLRIFKSLQVVNLGGWGLELLFLVGGGPAGVYFSDYNGLAFAKGFFTLYGFIITAVVPVLVLE